MLQKSFVEPQRGGYSNAVVTTCDTGGVTTVTVSGCVGWDPNDHSQIPGDVGVQAEKALASMVSTLKASGCPNGLGDIVKTTAYIVNINDEKVRQVGKAVHYAFKHLDKKQRAASTWVGVTGLVEEALAVEIECVAQFGIANKVFVQPQRAGFSNAVVTTSSNGIATVMASGQVGWDESGTNTPTDLSGQATNALTSLAKVLQDAGCPNGMGDVIQVNTYIVDIDEKKVGMVGKSVYNAFKHIHKTKLPASTWLGVTGLVEKDLKVEIECVAQYPVSSSITMDKIFVQPQRGYCNAVSTMSSADMVTTVIVSGQVGWNPNDHGDIPEDLGMQATNALSSMASVLQDAGCPNGMGDVIRLNAYIVNIDQEKVNKVGLAVHKAFKHLDKKQRAASTWVGVTGLVVPGLGVEIECTAQFKSDGRSRM